MNCKISKMTLILALSFLGLSSNADASSCLNNWMNGYWLPDLLEGKISTAEIPPHYWPQNYCANGIPSVAGRSPQNEGCFMIYTSWSGHRHICEWYESSNNPCEAENIWDMQSQQCITPEACTNSGATVEGAQCLPPPQCNNGKRFNKDTNQCESSCPNGQDHFGECNPPPEEKNCGAESNNPIDFASGEKLRREHIITVGAKYPITLTYYYNNHNNHEKTAAGIVANRHITHQVISTSTPISTTEYSANYNNKGLLKSAALNDQYYGYIEQYWRHSFDDVLQIRGDYYQLHLANGQTKTFQGLGASASHKDEALIALTAGEDNFTGFKWVNYKTGKEKRFDNTGRLRKVINGPAQITTLAYDTNGQLETISNSYGDSLTLTYTPQAADSIYAHSSNQTHYPTSITASNNQQVDLGWDHNFRGQTQTFHLLTRITEPYTTETSDAAPTTARDFAYGDSRWPASLTQIDTVKNIAANEKVTYATFQYDDQGRAIYSSLAGGADATTVNYVDELTRTVTNALGKDATYTFAMIDGVKRLKKVVGEPTTNCLQSEVEYIYNAEGTVFEKHQNGKVTRFTQYDNKGRELERIEAFGTPDARTIKTEWHPTLNVKTKVIEPKTTTEWEYFDDGKLKTTKTYATSI